MDYIKKIDIQQLLNLLIEGRYITIINDYEENRMGDESVVVGISILH